jgi:beta-glucosidase
MVLLKNNNDVLPIRPTTTKKKVLIVGPYADSRGNKDYMSFWTLGLGMRDYDSTKVVTPAQGLKPALEAMGYEVKVAQLGKNGIYDVFAQKDAYEASAGVDLIIACVGEQGINCGESRSVADIHLPGNQEEMLKTLKTRNVPVVMVLFNSRPLVFNWVSENIDAIVVAWQPGFETGNGLADLLTGKTNFTGRLPITFPRNLGQVPLYYNHLSTGRPQTKFGTLWTSGYLDSEATPAYPFGFGLSYSPVEYSEIRAERSTIGNDETFVANITVTNNGKMAVDEIVQCYIHDLSADIARPVKELKSFLRVHLEPGDSKPLQFNISPEDRSYWNQDLKFKCDPGQMTLFIGSSSEKVKKMEFNVVK